MEGNSQLAACIMGSTLGQPSGSGGGTPVHDKGYFATEAALIAAYPSGEAGDYAIVGETDTFWVWDADTSAWKNSGQAGSDHDKGYFATEAALIAAHPSGAGGDYAIVGETDTFWVWDTDTSAWKDTGQGVTLEWGNISGTLSDQTDLQDELDSRYPGTGVIIEPSYTDNTNGTCTIGGDGEYLFKAAADFTGLPFVKVTIPQTLINTLVDGRTNYIVARYNGGAPDIISTLDLSSINVSNVLPLFTVNRSGTTLGMLPWDETGTCLVNKIFLQLVKTQRFNREYGLEVGEKAGGYVTLTEGKIWYGGIGSLLAEFDSQTDNINLHTYTGSSPKTWTETEVHVYNNTQYNDSTGLHDLSSTNRYAVNWLYRCAAVNKNIVHMVLGGDDYKLNEAKASQPPADLPDVIRTHAILVGRIIVAKEAVIATVINSAFTLQFTPASQLLHNDLDSIQGGSETERYHLTADEYDYVQAETGNEGVHEDIHSTGFVSYETSLTDYWVQDGAKFRILKAGTGRFSGKAVTWVAGQEVTLTANKGYFIYIDENGLLQSKDASTLINSDKMVAFELFKTMFTNAIVLFSVWYDGVLMVVSKNNHGCEYTPAIGAHDHFRLGSVFIFTGALISLLSASSRTIQSIGRDLIDDHGVLTDFPDYTGTALATMAIWRNASGYAQRAHRRNFTISAPAVAPTAGARYTDVNGNTHVVINYSAPVLECYATVFVTEPPASGTLTKTSGTGDAALTFSAVTTNRVIPAAYSNAGVYTPLATSGASRYGILAVYALPTNMQTPNITDPVPNFMALLSTAAYAGTAAAAASLGTGTAPVMTQFIMPTEIEALEPVLMGFVMVDGSDRQIEAYTANGFVSGVRSYKQTPSSAFSAGAVAVASSVNVSNDTSSFNGIFSGTDTTSQQALDTIDNWSNDILPIEMFEDGAVPPAELDLYSPGNYRYRDFSVDDLVDMPVYKKNQQALPTQVRILCLITDDTGLSENDTVVFEVSINGGAAVNCTYTCPASVPAEGTVVRTGFTAVSFGSGDYSIQVKRVTGTGYSAEVGVIGAEVA